MADVKDILGVPRSGLGNDKPEQKEKKEKVKRPEGMSREAFALLGGVHPLMPSHLVDGLKRQADAQQKPKASIKGVVTYQWKPFTNQARTDEMHLHHWVKGYKDASGRIRDAEEGDYTFAKFNKKVHVYRYDDEEWASMFQNDMSGWSREETDYLLNMCEQFDLRFPVIIDRYQFPGGPPRTLEDVKDRYYRVARRLLVEREGGEARCANQVVVKAPYDKRHEEERRAALHILLTRNMRQDQEDQLVLEEARQIEEKRRAEAVQKRAAVASAAASAAAASQAQAAGAAAAAAQNAQAAVELPAVGPGQSSLLTADLQPLRPQKSGVYPRSLHARDTAVAAASAMAGGARTQKALEQALVDYNAVALPRVCTRQVCGTWLSLREAVMQLVDLRRQLQARQDDAKGGNKRGDKRKR